MVRMVTGNYYLAGCAVRVNSIYERVHELCADYRCEDCAPDITITIQQHDIDDERLRSSRTAEKDGRPTGRTGKPSDAYLEELAVYRKIAEAMPLRDTLLVHGSCVAVDGKAFLFCAPSGTGKSTHARLWREMLGDRLLMVNDDKPLLRLTNEGALAYGTPWNGKHQLSSNVVVPLHSICLLRRGLTNHIEPLPHQEAYSALLQHVYRPSDPAALSLTLKLMDQLMTCVTLWRLDCNMEIDAARISFAAMNGESQ